MRGLDGRRVILTGGASGIGRAAALRLAEAGCVVGIFDVNAFRRTRDRRAVCGRAGESIYCGHHRPRPNRRWRRVIRGGMRSGAGVGERGGLGTCRATSSIPTVRFGTG